MKIYINKFIGLSLLIISLILINNSVKQDNISFNKKIKYNKDDSLTNVNNKIEVDYSELLNYIKDPIIKEERMSNILNKNKRTPATIIKTER